MKTENKNFTSNDIADFVEQVDVLGLPKKKLIHRIKFKFANAPELNVSYASLGRRFVAKFIDLIVVSAILLFLESVFLKFNFADSNYIIFRVLFAAVIWLGYNTLLESSPLHATVGKMVLKIKVISVNGKELTVLNALSRSIFVIVSVLPAGLGIWYISTDKKNRAWHDLIAGSLVIKS
jgi:uncharacterized RDD family membrane protein YckC